MVVRDTCPTCGANRYKKNGHTRHGKQHHQWKACGRQCTAAPLDRRIASEQRKRIEHLLCDRISTLRGRPPRGFCLAGGIIALTRVHCASVRSEGYLFLKRLFWFIYAHSSARGYALTIQ